MRPPNRPFPPPRAALHWLWPAALLAALACSGTPEAEAIRSSRRSRPEQVFLDARVELQDGGQVRGAISARYMEQERRRSLIRMRDSVEVVSWDSLGRVESLTLCDSLLYRKDRRDMTAEGNVRVMAASDPKGKRLAHPGGLGSDLASLKRHPPFKLLTTRLEWVQRIQKIQSAEKITFYTPYDTLRGTGFRSDRNLRNWEIDQPEGVTHRAPAGRKTGSARERTP